MIHDEFEWLSSNDVQAMVIKVLDGEQSRQERLLCCACCRCIWDRLPDERGTRAVELAELHVDGSTTINELQSARHDAEESYRDASNAWNDSVQGGQETEHSYSLALKCAAAGVAYSAVRFSGLSTVDAVNRLSQHRALGSGSLPSIVRDIFGNPFKPLSVDPAVLTWSCSGRIPPVLARTSPRRIARSRVRRTVRDCGASQQ